MKLLSSDHVVVDLKINHPFFGSLLVDRFQRQVSTLDSPVIIWQGFVLKIISKSDVLKIDGFLPRIIIIVDENSCETESLKLSSEFSQRNKLHP